MSLFALAAREIGLTAIYTVIRAKAIIAQLLLFDDFSPFADI